MRIRHTLDRQESAESKAPLIATYSANDCGASTSSSYQNETAQIPGTPSTVSSDPFPDCGYSEDSFFQSPSLLSRPMAAVYINNTDPDRSKQLKNAHRSSKPISDSKTQSKVDEQNERDVENSRKELNPEGGPQLRSLEAVVDEKSKRPLRRSSTSNSQRQHQNSYGRNQTRLPRVFTRQSGFNYIFEKVSGTTDDSASESDTAASSIQVDIEKFENLYRRVRRKLKNRERDNSTESSDSDMSQENEEKKGGFGSRQMRRWAFWFIVAFLAALTIKDVVELVDQERTMRLHQESLQITEYSADPKQSDINVVFNGKYNDNAKHHILYDEKSSVQSFQSDRRRQLGSENLSNLSDRDSFLKSKWDYRMAVEGYEVISSLSSMERETESIHGTVHAITMFRKVPRFEGKRIMIKKWLNVIEERNVTFEEFTQKVGAEIIRPSMQRFQRLSFNEDLTIPTRFRTSWISEKQFCFQPWSPSADYMNIDDQGRFFTMSLSHNGENLNNKSVGCMTVDFHGRPSSLNRFMEGKGRTRDGFDDELCMGQYHEVVVEVRAKYEMLENDDNGTHCREQKEGQDNEFDCLSRCRMDMLREWCKCTPLTLGYLMRNPEEELKVHPHCNYEKCILDVQSRNYTDIECQKNCHRDCTQIRYAVTHKTQGRLLRPDMTVMELQWGSFEYLSMKQDWVWSVTTFIAALGGSIGLWLGLSILSLIQGGTYLYSYLTDTVIKKKIRKRKASVAPATKSDEDTKNSGNIAANPFETPFKKASKATAFNPPPAYNDGQKPTTNIQIE
ncbi:Amiloride-sensitive sodium channel subunit beta [Aphelenchoides besseyi]|nr:Amiloride-sensitive sodium channel subunit beta [Aphelenchoides besseyi]